MQLSWSSQTKYALFALSSLFIMAGAALTYFSLSILFQQPSTALVDGQVLAGGTNGLVVHHIPPLINSYSLYITGDKPPETMVGIETDTIPLIPITSSYTQPNWSHMLDLHEGPNQIHILLFPDSTAGSAPIDQVAKTVTVDTVGPACNLSYSSIPAEVGPLEIMLNCTEVITPSPRISINQSGSVDILGAPMSGSGSGWAYTYDVRPADGSNYRDGLVSVDIVTNGDMAGNPISSIDNINFEIDTSGYEPPTTDPPPTSPPPSNGSEEPDSPEPPDDPPVAESEDEPLVDTEVNTSAEAIFRFRRLDEDHVRANYRPGDVIVLSVQYEAGPEFLPDRNLDEYRYLGRNIADNFSGLWLDFSRIDGNFENRGVSISDRVSLADNIYTRTVRYRLSEDTQYRGNVVTAKYFVNGEAITEEIGVELDIRKQERKKITVSRIGEFVVEESELLDNEPQVSRERLLADGYRISGGGPANSLMQIRIFSDPVIAEVITDENGNWEYTITEDLGEGNHTVYAAVVEGEDDPTDFTQILNFVVTAEAQTVESIDTEGNSVFVSDAVGGVEQLDSTLSDNGPMRMLLIGVGIVFILAGFGIIVIYLRSDHSHKRDVFQTPEAQS